MAERTNQWGPREFLIQNNNATAFSVSLRGRERWALETLFLAASEGITPFNSPGPRWSAYVKRLRSFNVNIETLMEKHGGPFKGNHARYVLVSLVTPSMEAAA